MFALQGRWNRRFDDDCRKGALCWRLDADDRSTCVDLCTGGEQMPTCPQSGFMCAGSGPLVYLCLTDCDPLTQNCEGTDLCIPVGDGFVCAPDDSGDAGQVFDPCEFTNVCDEGLACISPQYATECDANAGGCCLPFCDLSEMNVVCPGAGQSCTSWFEEGMAPPEYANVGICIIPE